MEIDVYRTVLVAAAILGVAITIASVLALVALVIACQAKALVNDTPSTREYDALMLLTEAMKALPTARVRERLDTHDGILCDLQLDILAIQKGLQQKPQ